MAAALRYPLGQLNETSDFLQIGIVEYTPVGSPENGKSAVTVGSIDNIRSGGYYNRQTGTFVKGQKSTPQTIVNYGSPIRTSGQLKNKNKHILGSIILPIPSNIQDGNSVTFGPGNLDGLTASVLEYATSMMGKGQGITSLSDVGTLITDALKGGTSLLTGDALEYFTRNIAASAANIPFGGNLTASQLLARQTGQILNPNMELLFEGVTLRSFKFSFKLTPRGPQEAAAIKDIIRILKQNMTPQSNGVYLKTPNIFELTYKKGSDNHPFLHKFKQCALTDMSVNYTGEGVYATYGGSVKDGGGTPVSMIMDLGFKELEPIYSDDYNDGEGLEGVGY
jgi:hypothetical protein